MRSELDLIFASTGADPVRAAVVRALRTGVRAAGDSYAFGQPRTDGYTYGNDLWRFVCYEMGSELGALPGAMVRHPRGSFLVDLGDAALYPFRYGDSWSADVTVCRLADSQFRRELLVDPRTEPHLFWPQVVLVPYAANPHAGLVRAYLGGARIQEGDLLDWQWLEELDVGELPSGVRPEDSEAQVPLFHSPQELHRLREPELDLTLTDLEEGLSGQVG